ncbi:MAG: hydrogenase maturation nickel metallochaperone HypA [Candidatus Poribacteria bacterium]
MSIVASILETVLQEAEKHRANWEESALLSAFKVKSIKLRVGKLWQIVPDTLEFCYSIATQGTIADGSEMIIVQTPIVARCKRCGKSFEVNSYLFICPDCNIADAEVISGDELILETIEMEDSLP